MTSPDVATQGDVLTVLSTVGPYLTKVFHADGRVDSYDDAASFNVRKFNVANLAELSTLLDKLATKRQSCIIRGKFIGPENAVPGKQEGTWARQNNNFDDQPLHTMCIDIDGYRPGFADPVREPTEAIEDFLREHLPPCFHEASFHWQLSSSAGTRGKEGILKAHVWFWLKTPLTSGQLYAWAKHIGPAIDKAVYRRVQVHYTANPVFEEGAIDPVPQRMGLRLRAHDEVDLQVDQVLLDAAHTAGAGTGGDDMKLVDPSAKEGLVGLFHRVYDAKHVLSEILADHGFEEVTERRWTWHGGGGTPEGVWVHDDGMHVGSSHNTWPLDGIANLWDVVRVFKFGDLDKAEDDFTQVDIDATPFGAKPSDLAMLNWAAGLPEILAANRQEREAAVRVWLDQVAAADSTTELETVIAPGIREAEDLSSVERERLAVAIQSKIKDMEGVKMPISDLRKWVRQASGFATNDQAPEWAKYWVWTAEKDGFLNIDTKQVISERSYNARYDRFMTAYMDESGIIPRASDMALKVWDTKVVDVAIYLPSADLFFTIDGMKAVNVYRPDLSPLEPSSLDQEQQAAVRIVEQHAEMLVPDERERNLLFDFLAYCVQKPGAKIRWGVLLKGIPGDGKTAFATMLSYVMGHKNVRTLNSKTLEKSDFSGWSVGQCVVTIEELKLHGLSRYDVYNSLKPYISNDVVEVHPKGREPYSAPNTSNYLSFTNFDDAIPLDDNDRRIYFLRSPFATKEDLFARIKELTGMDAGDYFDRLFDQAIKKHPGALRKWLLDRELSPEFRPDGRAPVTAARGLLVDLSRPDDENAVIQELEIGGEGVYQDIVSTAHLGRLIRRKHEGVDVRTRRLSSILSGMGYQPAARVWWKGEMCRVYTLGKAPADLAKVMDAKEKDRLDREVSSDFVD